MTITVRSHHHQRHRHGHGHQRHVLIPTWPNCLHGGLSGGGPSGVHPPKRDRPWRTTPSRTEFCQPKCQVAGGKALLSALAGPHKGANVRHEMFQRSSWHEAPQPPAPSVSSVARPFLTTPLHHHFPSSPLPFLTTSHRHHLPSSPPPIVTTSFRHHPVSYLLILCDVPPFIKVNPFVMYCYVV